MSAVTQPLEAQFDTMTPLWLDAVLEVEKSVYEHPWTRGNFIDSLHAGYQAQLLMAGDNTGLATHLLGYFVAMQGVDEVHLLNITVAPVHQKMGWARVMLDALVLWARGQGAQWLWLEVRVSNPRAQHVYTRYGFREIGKRRDYYPTGGSGSSKREDAVVMSFAL